MKEINNFKLHEEATQLSDITTNYKLAKMYLTTKEEFDKLKEKYEQLNLLFEDYLSAHKVVLTTEISRLQMQQNIDRTKIQYELEC